MCGICEAKLFEQERIYAIGPGTQEHIEFEVFVWGDSIRCDVTMYNGDDTQLNCWKRCHDPLGLFLIARHGSFIDTCGFAYAGACGPSLVHLSFCDGLQDGQPQII